MSKTFVLFDKMIFNHDKNIKLQTFPTLLIIVLLVFNIYNVYCKARNTISYLKFAVLSGDLQIKQVLSQGYLLSLRPLNKDKFRLYEKLLLKGFIS